MDFQRARSKEEITIRIQEIIDASLKIFDTTGVEGLTFSAISKETHFTRPTIYKYFCTKEDILLEIFHYDLKNWLTNLEGKFSEDRVYTTQEIAHHWSHTLCQNERLLKVNTYLFSTLEKNASFEALVEFKKKLSLLQNRMVHLINSLFTEANMDNITDFITSQMALAIGLYPMINLTELQKQAMAIAGTSHTTKSFETLFENNILILLKNLQKSS